MPLPQLTDNKDIQRVFRQRIRSVNPIEFVATYRLLLEQADPKLFDFLKQSVKKVTSAQEDSAEFDHALYPAIMLWTILHFTDLKAQKK